jgi:hypothetical protein
MGALWAQSFRGKHAEEKSSRRETGAMHFLKQQDFSVALNHDF